MPLQLLSLCHDFGRWRALENVSLHVEDGDCYGFLGHNGAGKTTSMRIALGLMRPSSGQVIVDNFDAARHPREARARMGGLIEVPGFHGGWDGCRNLTSLACLAGLPRLAARKEAERQLCRVGLDDVGSKPVRAYSHGMRQRLGIAQALLCSPRYVLLDEPTNGLDPEGIAEMRALLLELREESHLTVLISSHQLAELDGLCNRIGVIRKGRLVVEGAVSELLRSEGDRHRHRYLLEVTEESDVLEPLSQMQVDYSSEGSGRYQLEIGESDPTDILSRLVSRGVKVRAFVPEKPTLEEFYLRHTREEPELETQHLAAPLPPVTQRPTPAKRRVSNWPILRLLRYDLGRWVPQVRVWLILLCPAAIGALEVLKRHDLSQTAEDAMGAGTLQTRTEVTGFEGLGLALQAGLPLLVFIALGFASQSLAGERGGGTLRNVLLRPVRRFQVALGKGASVLLAVFMSYALLVIVGFAASSWAFEFRDLSEVLPNGELYIFPEFTAEKLWGEVSGLITASLLPLTAITGLGFLAGSLVRKAATGLAFALILGALLDMLRILARGARLEHWLPSAYLPSPVTDTSYVQYYVDAVTGVGNPTFSYEDTAISHPLFWAVVSFALAALVLIRRPVP